MSLANDNSTLDEEVIDESGSPSLNSEFVLNPLQPKYQRKEKTHQLQLKIAW